MGRLVMGVLAAVVAASCLAGPGEAAAAARRPAPRDSFLEYRAGTVEALALQAERNPRVRARYARHFGIPASRVAQFIRENLVVSYLPRAGSYRVYYVTPGGRIYSRQTRLPQGTRVLTLRNGEPVLQWICGNALVPELPRVAVRQVRQVPPAPAPAVVSVPGEELVAVPRAISVPTQQVTVQQIPVVVPAPVVPAVPAPVAVPAVPVTPVVVARRPPQVLPVVAVGPGLIEVITHERPPEVTPPVVPPPAIVELPPPEIPIPEPGGIAMLAMGALPMAWAAIRSRRGRKSEE